jgi:hypothetical protein
MTEQPRRSIAYCNCGNVSLDGLNFTRLEAAAIRILECGRCGAVSSDFLFVPERQAREEWEAELLSDEAVRRAADFAAASWDEDFPDTQLGIARGMLEEALAAAKERGDG